MLDADRRRNCVWHIWELFVLSLQLLCTSKSTLKVIFFKGMGNTKCIQIEGVSKESLSEVMIVELRSKD